MTIPMPKTVQALAPLSAELDAASHEERLTWVRSLSGGQQLALYALADGNAVSANDFVRGDGEVVIHEGRNGLPVFNRFQKRFARLGDEIVGYNHNESGLIAWFAGPGHYTSYDAPDKPGEVWVDYRTIPTRQHPDYPPLIDNDHGTRSLVFGNMVDRLRRVSQHVFIGNAYKDLPSPHPITLGSKIGRLLGTAPFVLCQTPASGG